MPTLRQILTAHSPVLVLDAASTRIQVGWLSTDAESRWETMEDEAGVALFACVHALKLKPSSAGAFIFCEGPGSILGVRTAATAIRTWVTEKARPVFAYQSLALVACALDDRELIVIADARRESWHCTSVGAPLARVATSELPGKRAVTPEGFRRWSAAPTGLTTTPYVLADLLKHAAGADLFTATEQPDAFLHDAPSYVTWVPHIHRAPLRS